jgi:membrane protein YdbS with pleckstrin-like domain
VVQRFGAEVQAQLQRCAFSIVQVTTMVLSVVVLPCVSKQSRFAAWSYSATPSALVAPLGAFFAVAVMVIVPAPASKA